STSIVFAPDGFYSRCLGQVLTTTIETTLSTGSTARWHKEQSHENCGSRVFGGFRAVRHGRSSLSFRGEVMGQAGNLACSRRNRRRPGRVGGGVRPCCDPGDTRRAGHDRGAAGDRKKCRRHFGVDTSSTAFHAFAGSQ